jgi:uncharacterized phiE125 gp8 family phage protein
MINCSLPRLISRLAYIDAEETVSLAEVKTQARVEFDDEDTLLRVFSEAARERCELEIQSKIRRQTVVLEFWGWAAGLMLSGLGPNIEVTAVEVVRPDGTELVPATVYTIKKGPVSMLVLRENQTWPDLEFDSVVRVTANAGYENRGAVPVAIKQWIAMMAATMYKVRESHSDKQMVSLGFVDGLLDPYRVTVA